MNHKIIYTGILIYIIFVCSIFAFYNRDSCQDICESELLGNLMDCLDMDPQCYQYYYNIYKECIQKC